MIFNSPICPVFRGQVTCEDPSLFERLERREARKMYFRNFSVKVIQGPHRERTFALDRYYQVLAVHLEETQFTKTHVLLEDDNHSLQWVPSSEVTVNMIE
jgi:hypothetical protein